MTTVNRTATLAGRRFQRQLTEHLRSQGRRAENLALSGAEDEGDVWTEIVPGVEVVIEAKREKAFSPATWVKEAILEAANYMKHRRIPPFEHDRKVRWAAVAARRNHSIDKAYVVLEVQEWVGQLEAAFASGLARATSRNGTGASR